MNRLGEMQLCPALRNRPRTARCATRGRSASASTTNGSDPPSSSTDFLISRPAIAPTALPARSLPVMVTAPTRGSAISRSVTAGTSGSATSSVVNNPSGSPAPAGCPGGQRRAGGVGGVLQQRGVAGHQRRGGESKHLPQREVPRHHSQHHPDRLIGHPAAVRRRVVGLVGQEGLGVFGVELQPVGALVHLGPGSASGLPISRVTSTANSSSRSRNSPRRRAGPRRAP